MTNIPITSTATTAARVESLRKAYGSGDAAVIAVADVTLAIGSGEFTAIMGPSGSGKSTLMHIMAGLDAPTAGRVWVAETEITELDDNRLTVLRRRQIGFVFQAFNLVPTLDVESNIVLPLVLDGRRVGSRDRERLTQLVGELGLTDRMRHRPHELSGGQQQRVAIARALMSRPDILFADEPTGNLDPRTGREVLELLCRANRQHGQTIVMVTHDPVAAAHADRVVYLADGRIVRDAVAETAEQIAQYILTIEAPA